MKEYTFTPTGVIEREFPDIAPAVVTLAQARAALRRAGLFAAADAAVKAAGGDALDFWEYGNTISRTSPTVAALASELNLTDAQVDALFVSAAGIAV